MTIKIGPQAALGMPGGGAKALAEARMGVWRANFQMISADSQRRMATGSYGF